MKIAFLLILGIFLLGSVYDPITNKLNDINRYIDNTDSRNIEPLKYIDQSADNLLKTINKIFPSQNNINIESDSNYLIVNSAYNQSKIIFALNFDQLIADLNSELTDTNNTQFLRGYSPEDFIFVNDTNNLGRINWSAITNNPDFSLYNCDNNANCTILGDITNAQGYQSDSNCSLTGSCSNIAYKNQNEIINGNWTIQDANWNIQDGNILFNYMTRTGAGDFPSSPLVFSYWEEVFPGTEFPIYSAMRMEPFGFCYFYNSLNIDINDSRPVICNTSTQFRVYDVVTYPKQFFISIYPEGGSGKVTLKTNDETGTSLYQSSFISMLPKVEIANDTQSNYVGLNPTFGFALDVKGETGNLNSKPLADFVYSRINNDLSGATLRLRKERDGGGSGKVTGSVLETWINKGAEDYDGNSYQISSYDGSISGSYKKVFSVDIKGNIYSDGNLIIADHINVGANADLNMSAGDINVTTAHVDILRYKSPPIIEFTNEAQQEILMGYANGQWVECNKEGTIMLSNQNLPCPQILRDKILRINETDRKYKAFLTEKNNCDESINDFPDYINWTEGIHNCLLNPQKQINKCESKGKEFYWRDNNCLINPKIDCMVNKDFNYSWDTRTLKCIFNPEKDCINNKGIWNKGICYAQPEQKCLSITGKIWDGVNCVDNPSIICESDRSKIWNGVRCINA